MGWHQEIGDLRAIIDTVDRRMADEDWFVTPLWQPQYLNDVYDLRPLRDPLGAFPAPDRAVNLEGTSPLQAAREWMERNPDTVAAWFA
ncbi:glycine betaine ABC transporter substrate-binding protein [Kocuria marina]|uniref:glycine betaine ABC transporter substrate-binding protein n=1 Tax=Kocuria marina TaxID=223184 RepID=UPI002989C1C2|nr:glycine betaine ABC transporter substrate-binding protein [Kocuria marina]